ncbi:hypothetical protein [Nitrincola iocasae]|nr:hypothetical protein [Nitrincola iocasae]
MAKALANLALLDGRTHKKNANSESNIDTTKGRGIAIIGFPVR